MHWQILLWPFRLPALYAMGIYALVAVVFTIWASLDFWVGVIVLSLGLPVWYAVFGQLSLYADKLMTQAATGLFDERIESETDINPFQQGLGLKYFFAHGIVFVTLFYNGPEPSWLLLIPAILFPMLWLSVVFDDSLLGGFRPRQVGRLLGGLHVFYPIAMLLISGTVGFMHYALLYANSVLNIALSALLFLYGNIGFGVLLYWRRRDLNLDTMRSPEQTLAAELDAQTRALDSMFHELHTHSANGNFGTAIAILEKYVASDPVALDPLMHERLQSFQDERLCLEHAVRYLQRLVGRGEERKAWVLMKSCLAMDERFRPPDDQMLLSLTRAAGREDAGLVNEVLKDFEQAYPDSQVIPDAWFRRARICIELLRDGESGVRLLSAISSDYPEFASGEAFRSYRKRLKIS